VAVLCVLLRAYQIDLGDDLPKTQNRQKVLPLSPLLNHLAAGGRFLRAPRQAAQVHGDTAHWWQHTQLQNNLESSIGWDSLRTYL
jgi:hypothetical protein